MAAHSAKVRSDFVFEDKARERQDFASLTLTIGQKQHFKNRNLLMPAGIKTRSYLKITVTFTDLKGDLDQIVTEDML